MATPQVAAALAILWAKRPTLTAGQVMVRLLDAADVVAGVGRVLNLDRALRAIASRAGMTGTAGANQGCDGAERGLRVGVLLPGPDDGLRVLDDL